MVDVPTVLKMLDTIKGAENLIHEMRLIVPPDRYSDCNKYSCALDRVYRELQAAVTKPLEIEQ